MDNMEKWVSLQEICDHLDLSKDTVKRLANKEGLPAYKPDGKRAHYTHKTTLLQI